MAIDRGQGIAITQKLAESYDVGSLVEDTKASEVAAAASALAAAASETSSGIVLGLTFGYSEDTEEDATAAAASALAASDSADTSAERAGASFSSAQAAAASAASIVHWEATGLETIHADRYTDTVYDSTINDAAVALNTLKVSNISHPTVSAAVPSGAVFTDTVTEVIDKLDDTSSTKALSAKQGSILNEHKVSQVGGTMLGTLKHGTNVKEFYGAGDELQVYYDGTDAVIENTGTGKITLGGNGVAVATGLTIDDTKVPKVFTQTDNPTVGTFEAGDLWWDTDGYTCRIAVLIGSSLAWFST